MTSFQRLRNGLNVLDRYAGITSVECSFPDIEPALTEGITPALLVMRLVIPIPSSLTLDSRDRDKLAKLGWRIEQGACIFQP